METRWATAAEISRLPLPEKAARVLVLADGDDIRIVATLIYEGGPIPCCYLDILKPVSKVGLHRFGRKALEVARSLRIPGFLACADKNVPRSREWLERLGLVEVGECEKGALYQCHKAA